MHWSLLPRGNSNGDFLAAKAPCYSHLNFEVAAPRAFQHSGIFCPVILVLKSKQTTFDCTLHAHTFSLTQTPGVEYFQPRKSGKIIVQISISDKTLFYARIFIRLCY